MQERERDTTTSQAAPGAHPFRVRPQPEQRTLARDGRQQDPEVPPAEVGQLRGVYIISVAARLLEMHPQTLRKYERLGLIRPFRTIGMLRLYSEEDLRRLRLIRHLEENLGLNLAGVEFTLNLLNHLLEMVDRLSDIEEAGSFIQIVEQEMSTLFRSLNLPLREQG